MTVAQPLVGRSRKKPTAKRTKKRSTISTTLSALDDDAASRAS
jgi:hypothetical protein